MNRVQIRQGWIDLVKERDWDEYVTLNFNHSWSPIGARKKFSLFCQRLDRFLLGRGYRKRVDKRTYVIAFLEHPNSNIHLHCLVRLRHGWRPRRRHLKRKMKRIWKKLVPSGTADVRRVRDAEGAARYSTKEFRFDEIILSSEFWPTGDYLEHHSTGWGVVRDIVKCPRP
jgi:hypothetical protein